MSHQQRLVLLPLVGTAILGLLVGVYLAVWKWFSQPEPVEPIAKHSVDTSADDALKYWTAKKMRKAKPAPMPHVGAPDRGKKPPRRPPQGPEPRKP